MKSKLTLIVGLTAILLMSLIYACRKELEHFPQQDDVTITLTDSVKVKMFKSYYSQMLKREGKVAPSSTKLYPGTNKPFQNLKFAMWKKAHYFETKTGLFAEIPLNYLKRSTLLIGAKKGNSHALNSEIFRGTFDRLIIYKNKASGKFDVKIVSYIPEISYLRKHQNDISHNYLDKIDKDFTGFLEYKKWDGTRLYYIKKVNGRGLKKTYFRPKSKVKSKENVTTNALYECGTEWIPEYGECCVSVGPEGEEVEECEECEVGGEEVPQYCDDGLTGNPCIDYGECDEVDDCMLYGIGCNEGGGEEINVVIVDINTAQICGYYNSTHVGSSYTGTVNNLGTTVTINGGTPILVSLGSTCFSIPDYSGVTPASASLAFLNAYNFALTEMVAGIKTGAISGNPVSMRSFLSSATTVNLQAYRLGSTFSTSACSGSVASSNAQYCTP